MKSPQKKNLWIATLSAMLGVAATPLAFADSYILGGLDGGYTSLSTNPLEGGKNGYQTNLKLLGSMDLSQSWVGDLGLGWMLNSVQGKDAIGQETQINTRAGFIEATARYKLLDLVQLGPVIDYVFGSDLSFGPQINLPTSSRSALFLGVQALHEFALDKNPLRVGLRYTTDASVSSRQVHIIQASVQFGFSIFGSEKEPENETRPVAQNNEPAPLEPVVMTQELPKQELKIELGVQMIHFETGSAKLKASSRSKLKELGKFLAAHSQVWSSVKIDGHTDERGGFKFNLKLSKARALSVKKAILAGGVNSKKLRVVAYSLTKPVINESNPTAWARNRRVELSFKGVSDPALIRDKIDQLEGEAPVAALSVTANQEQAFNMAPTPTAPLAQPTDESTTGLESETNRLSTAAKIR